MMVVEVGRAKDSSMQMTLANEGDTRTNGKCHNQLFWPAVDLLMGCLLLIANAHFGEQCSTAPTL